MHRGKHTRTKRTFDDGLGDDLLGDFLDDPRFDMNLDDPMFDSLDGIILFEGE